MSTPQTPRTGRRATTERRDLGAVAVAIPVLIGVLLSALLYLDRPTSETLMVQAPSAARPGDRVALRAVRVDADAFLPPAASASPMGVRIVDPVTGAVVARAPLGASSTVGAEGAIEVPADRVGEFWLEVEAADPHTGALSVHRRGLRIDVDAPPLPAIPRALGEPRAEATGAPPPDGSPPDRLELRVGGGACVPELPCDLLVAVGRPGASLAIVPVEGAVELEGRDPEPAVTEPVVEFRARLHGPRAAVDVVATREGVETARRRVELPVALGLPAVRVERALGRGPARAGFEVAFLEPGRPFVVDLFREGRWEHAFSVPGRESAPTLGHVLRVESPSRLEPGSYRVEVRASPLDRDALATDLFVVTPPATGLGAALEALASRLEPDLPLRVAASPEVLDVTARFLLAPSARERIALPDFEWATDGSAARAATVRGGLAVVVLLLGLFSSLLLWRRGLASVRQADGLLRGEDEGVGHVPGLAPRGRLEVAGAALFVLLVFAVVAAIVLSRGCL